MSIWGPSSCRNQILHYTHRGKTQAINPFFMRVPHNLYCFVQLESGWESQPQFLHSFPELRGATSTLLCWGDSLGYPQSSRKQLSLPSETVECIYFKYFSLYCEYPSSRKGREPRTTSLNLNPDTAAWISENPIFCLLKKTAYFTTPFPSPYGLASFLLK